MVQASQNKKNMKFDILAVYAATKGFSGQKEAFETVLNGLEKRGWRVKRLNFPSLDRTANQNWLRRNFQLPKMALLTLSILFTLAFSIRGKQLFVCLGQTKYSMWREGSSISVLKLVSPKSSAIIATNGSDLLNWSLKSPETKVFRRLVNKSFFVSVLGPKQREKLLSLEVSPDKVEIVDNTATIEVQSVEMVCQKQVSLPTLEKPIKVLFLSSLIESKGYILFLEALSWLAKNTEVALSAKLCGKITTDPGRDKKFNSVISAANWIKREIAAINESNFVKAEWHDGVQGELKNQIFRDSHIFVLPTMYPTEAQPLVLLEALASGCSIVTTKAGEIGSTLSDETAIFLPVVTSESIAMSILQLAKDPTVRSNLATNGIRLFETRFSYEKHIDRWENLFLTKTCLPSSR